MNHTIVYSLSLVLGGQVAEEGVVHNHLLAEAGVDTVLFGEVHFLGFKVLNAVVEALRGGVKEIL